MTALLNRSGAAVADAITQAFAAGLAGRAIRPGDADYDAARRSGTRRSTVIRA